MRVDLPRLAPERRSGGDVCLAESTLVLDAPPLDVNVRKTVGPSTWGIAGAGVFAAGFARALLRHGSFGRYCFFRGRQRLGNGDAPDWAAGTGRHIECLDAYNIRDLQGLHRPVLVSPGQAFQDFRLARAVHSPTRDWPITGFIHSLQSSTPPAWLLSLALGDARPWDVLVCSSQAGRKVIEHYLEALPAAYPQLGRTLTSACELAVIPLGSDGIDPRPARRASIRRELRIADGQVAILYVGRLSPATKGDLVPLVRAFAEVVADREPRPRLVIAGDDTQHKLAGSIVSIARALGCGDTVSVHSDVTHDQKLDLYCAADVFVSVSDNLQETFGLTIVEALAAGLPVIASDWNGYRDLIEPGANGFLIPTYWTDLGSSFDAASLYASPLVDDAVLSGATIVDSQRLVDAMRSLVDNADLRAAMGARGRRSFLERFHWPVVIRQYEALWQYLQARAEREAHLYAPVSDVQRIALRHAFRHYPVASLSEDSLVTAASTSQADTLLASSPLLNGHVLPDAKAIAVDVLADVSSDAELTLSDIHQRAVARGSGDLSARLVVAHLLKYGLVAVVQEKVSGV